MAAPIRKKALHEYDGAGDYDQNNFNFHIGAPHPTELLECSQIVERAMTALAKEPNDFMSSAFQYGREQGAEPVLEALAGFLTQEYARDVRSENLMITGGASMAFSLVCMEFFTKYPGGAQPVVFVEHPTYFLVMKIALDHGFRVEAIPTYADGKINFAAWEIAANEIQKPASESSEKRFKALTYLVPDFRNPTGESMDEATAKKVHGFCVKQDILIHCDDVYNILYYGAEPPKTLFPVGDSDNVISSGTFSKLLGPGLRVGWIESSSTIIKKVVNNGVLVSGGCAAQFSSFLIERAINNGDLTKHVRDLRKTYTAKVNAFNAALSAGLPADIKWHQPKGGYFYWLVLPPGSSDFISKTLVPAAKEVGVRFGVGGRSCPFRGVTACHIGCPNAVRLSVGHVTLEQIPEGVARLCKLLRERPTVGEY